MAPARRIRLDLHLTEDPSPMLEATHFVHPSLQTPRSTHVGTSGFGRRTRGTNALIGFALHQLITARSSPEAPGGFRSEYFEGPKGSVAATLNYALTSKPAWLNMIFGASARGEVLLELMVERDNRDFKASPDGPVRMKFAYAAEFVPNDVVVFLDDKAVTARERLISLYRRLHEEDPTLPWPIDSAPEGDAPDPTHAREYDGGAVCPPSPSLFIGRTEFLGQIVTHLRRSNEGSSGGHGRLLVLRGWPGIGKSTIAAALCHMPTIREMFPDGILWACLGPSPSAPPILLEWASALQLPVDYNAASQPHLSMRMAASLNAMRVLIVIDDVWKAQHCAPLLLSGPRCATVITTRLPEVASLLAVGTAEILNVPALSEESALRLLETLAPEAVRDAPGPARELLKSVEYLPLAIRVAGRLLAVETRLGWDIHDLLESIRADASRLLSEPAPLDAAFLAYGTLPTVSALLRQSTDSLPEGARDRFIQLGALAPHPATFDLDALAALWDIADARPVVRVLVQHGLLEPIGGRYQMHALLVAHSRRLAEP